MHMGFVCGIIFLVIRGGLALFPAIALRYPIKKWAAGGSILICFLYLLLTGFGAPTQRAFVMISIVMLAVILDRRALSMRLLAFSAMIVMVIAPEVVIGPGFQMSFAAVAALIAAAESALARKLPSLGEGPLASAGDHILAIGLTTVIASIATEPFAAFHFDHIALYSIPANMIAVPITAVWNMPWGLLALIAMPFGCEGPFLTMMGFGIALVIEVSRFLTALPDAIIQVPAMPGASLALLAIGLAWICLWQQSWRWAGILPVLCAFGLWAGATVPDMIIDPSTKTIAIRAEDGRLKFLPGRPKLAPAESWMERDGAGRQTELPMAGPADHITCDAMGCIWRRPDQVLVAIARHKLAPLDDCRQADLVITADQLDHCPSARAVIDRKVLQELGAHSIRFHGDDWLIETAIAPGTNRPWVKARNLSAMRDEASDEDGSDDDDGNESQGGQTPSPGP
jgi:competence protein ComEC